MTTPVKFNNPCIRIKILVAPLEWGLGHATRCIPIIHKLLQLDCDVLLAAEGATAFLLKNEFPRLQFMPLTGYRMKYSRKKNLLPFRLFIQLPRVILTIYKEHHWLKKVVKHYKIDAIISDNRFGLYHKAIPSIYITHQLLIKTFSSFTEKVAQWIHYSFIKKYSECWIPDALNNGLAGELSHPRKLPSKSRYIGPISRFEISGNTQKKYDLLIIISGPEPQRTIFEEILMNDLKSYTGKTLFVRGIPGGQQTVVPGSSSLEIINHLDAAALNIAMQQSNMIISRSGYTTIMDLVKLKRKAVLVPTPGQTEQEYLAEYMMERNMFYTVRQENFSLNRVLDEIALFPSDIPTYNMKEYNNVVENFVAKLRRGKVVD